jgi:hypothetical protein
VPVLETQRWKYNFRHSQGLHAHCLLQNEGFLAFDYNTFCQIRQGPASIHYTLHWVMIQGRRNFHLEA